ncbi:MAG: thiamine pyrophosphate-dependent dehydrogenase E1 component subunit alpha, partial [Bacteroidia bacterium]
MIMSSTTPESVDEPLFIREQALKAYRLMLTAEVLARTYETHKDRTAKYVHATSRGHEAIQLAMGMQLKAQDFVAPYYRDDALLLGMGITPYELMLQLFAKREDIFSGGRTYYSHPSLRRDDMPKIPHQSSATGMQVIPITGVAQGMQYRENQALDKWTKGEAPVAVCSIGDGAMTEGEVSEALQMAALHQYPILYLVQDNGWGISAQGSEMYAQNAAEFAKGFHGIETISIDGTDFATCYSTIAGVLDKMRQERRPFLIHAQVPLLNHHTSGVRKEWYRDDLASHQPHDPLPQLKAYLLANGVSHQEIEALASGIEEEVLDQLEQAFNAEDPKPEDL